MVQHDDTELRAEDMRHDVESTPLLVRYTTNTTLHDGGRLMAVGLCAMMQLASGAICDVVGLILRTTLESWLPSTTRDAHPKPKIWP